MQPSARQALDAALAVTERMLAAGQASDWPTVIDLEPGRRELLARAFRAGETMDQPAADRVSAILALDEQLIALGTEARSAVARELGQMQRGAKATRAYRKLHPIPR